MAEAAAGCTSPSTTPSGSTPRTPSCWTASVGVPNTPLEVRRLLLPRHPLVIYRFGPKQADVILALFLQGEELTFEEKLADSPTPPRSPGDWTLSAITQ